VGEREGIPNSNVAKLVRPGIRPNHNLLRLSSILIPTWKSIVQLFPLRQTSLKQNLLKRFLGAAQSSKAKAKATNLKEIVRIAAMNNVSFPLHL
jgi:hypothetical protein